MPKTSKTSRKEKNGNRAKKLNLTRRCECMEKIGRKLLSLLALKMTGKLEITPVTTKRG